MKAFISYSHHDRDALDRLHTHLANLQREGRIDAWFDRNILAGDVLDDEIKRELESADLILLLISPDFIASDYCIEREMRRALERHEEGQARVIPIIVEPCDWAAMAPLRRLKAVPTDGNPISEWANANNAYLNIVQELRRIASTPEAHEADSEPGRIAEPNEIPQAVSRYRTKRDFDEIDRAEYREAAFESIRRYFRRSIAEINTVEGLKGRFVDRGATTFGSTVVNAGHRHGTSHITVHCRSAGYTLGDIYYSFEENAADNTANGGFNVSCDEYEQFLVVTLSMFRDENERLSPEDAAEQLWNNFIEKAGITYA